MNEIVECVPNFSEGRSPEVIQAIADSMDGVEGVRVLHLTSDEDHNRSVITLAGSMETIAEAAFRGIAEAAKRINLEEQRGEHPRLGATDVVPFVPVCGVTLEDCVELAKTLGERVGRELGIPVYLYEAAATRPDRINIADVRRGEYERLKDEITTNLDRAPDFGPSCLTSAGATIIGARPFLVAFNVFLTTDDVAIAKAIAKAIRGSSGGLRYVKALGFSVAGQAQVSMNLTNFEKTPIHRAVELIRREAALYGVQIARSELIGMIPQQALVDAAVWYLQMDGFQPEQILENRLAEGE